MPRKVLDTPEREESTRTRVIAFARRNALNLIALGLFTIAIALLVGLEPDVGRVHVLVALSAIWGVLVGYPISGYVVGKIGEEPGVFIVELAADDPQTGALYWYPYTEFRSLQVVDGELDKLAPSLYAARSIDPEAHEATGTWRGSLTDRELLTALQAVQECRGMLEEDARRAFALETSLWSIVYRGTKQATKSVIETFETSMLPDRGKGVDAAVNNALEEFGLGDSIGQVDEVTLDELVDDADGHDRADADDQESAGQEVTAADD